MLDDLHAETFRSHLNSIFSIHHSPLIDLVVELVEVTEKEGLNGQQPLDARQERFSVVFRVPRDRWLPQGMYQLQHYQLGALDLFLVPVGQDHDGLYYEAVFNRLRHLDA